MSEVTAVPLRPVSKSGLAVLWVGLLALVLGAGAWAMTLSDLAKVDVVIEQAGSGRPVTAEDVVLIKYEGRLADGTVFDSQEQAPFDAGGTDTIEGFKQGLQGMQIGGKYRLSIPSELGYGGRSVGPIPANSDLVFDIEVLDMRSRAEVQAMQQQQQMMQQMMQQQGGGAAGPEGAAPPQ